MRRATLIALACSLSAVACSPGDQGMNQESGPPTTGLRQRVLGSWHGENATRGSMWFRFAADQQVTWVVERPGRPETLSVDYSATERDGRLLLDLSGFESGPLVGLVMFGLAEFDGEDTLRLDFEPAPPGNDQSRPAALTSSDVLTLVRADGRQRRCGA